LRPSPPFQGLIKAASGKLYAEKEFIEQFGTIQKTKTERQFKTPRSSKTKASQVDSKQTASIITNLIQSFDDQDKDMQIID